MKWSSRIASPGVRHFPNKRYARNSAENLVRYGAACFESNELTASQVVHVGRKATKFKRV